MKWKDDKKMALITTWWWLSQNTTLGPKSQNQNTWTFSWRKLTKWLVDWEKGKRPSLSFKDLVAQTFYNQGVLLRIQRLVLKGTTERAEGATQLVECFPSMYKALCSVPSAANESPTKRNPRMKIAKKLGGGGKIESLCGKGLAVYHTRSTVS